MNATKRRISSGTSARPRDLFPHESHRATLRLWRLRPGHIRLHGIICVSPPTTNSSRTSGKVSIRPTLVSCQAVCDPYYCRISRVCTADCAPLSERDGKYTLTIFEPASNVLRRNDHHLSRKFRTGVSSHQIARKVLGGPKLAAVPSMWPTGLLSSRHTWHCFITT